MEWRRRDILRALIIVGVLWVGLMVVLGRWQSRAQGRRDPKLLHYPGTESVQEQVVPNLGFHKYWFHFTEDYPSRRVYEFYQAELPIQGWRYAWSGEPQWARTVAKDKETDLFEAGWVSADGLFEITLQMVSEARLTNTGGDVVQEDRKPGMEVYVTMRRVLVPQSFGKEGGGK